MFTGLQKNLKPLKTLNFEQKSLKKPGKVLIF